MKNFKKMMMIQLIFLLLLALGAGGWWYMKMGKSNPATTVTQEPTAKELASLSVDVPEANTNLKDGASVKMSIKLVAMDKNGLNEVNLRMFQVSDLVTKQLNDLDTDQVIGKVNLTAFEQKLKDSINTLLKEGKIRDVYVTQFWAG